jgi:hypothetical protein
MEDGAELIGAVQPRAKSEELARLRRVQSKTGEPKFAPELRVNPLDFMLSALNFTGATAAPTRDSGNDGCGTPCASSFPSLTTSGSPPSLSSSKT